MSLCVNVRMLVLLQTQECMIQNRILIILVQMLCKIKFRLNQRKLCIKLQQTPIWRNFCHKKRNNHWHKMRIVLFLSSHFSTKIELMEDFLNTLKLSKRIRTNKPFLNLRVNTCKPRIKQSQLFNLRGMKMRIMVILEQKVH